MRAIPFLTLALAGCGTPPRADLAEARHRYIAAKSECDSVAVASSHRALRLRELAWAEAHSTVPAFAFTCLCYWRTCADQ